MHSLRLILTVALSATALVPLAAAPKREPVLIDFTYVKVDTTTGEISNERAFSYSYGDWGGGKVKQIREKGLLINHLGSKGGLGDKRRLNLRDATRVRVAFILGNGNAATSFRFSLVDGDGSEHSFDIPLTDQPKGQPISAVLDLTTPANVDKPGTTPGLDLKKLQSWQLKGNHGNAPLEVLVERVTAATTAE